MKSFPLRWAQKKKKELDLLLIILSWAWPQLENFLLYSHKKVQNLQNQPVKMKK